MLNSSLLLISTAVVVARKLKVLVAHDTVQHVANATHLAIATRLHNVGKAVRDALHAADKALFVKRAVAAVGAVVHRLQRVDLVVAEPGLLPGPLVRLDGLRDRLLQRRQLLLGRLEVNARVGQRCRRRLREIDLGLEAAAAQQHAGVGEIAHELRHEEARQREGAAADAGEEDVGLVKGNHLRQHVGDEVVDGLGVCGAVRTLHAVAVRAAPFQVLVRGKHSDAHEVRVDALVGKVEEGLATVTVEQHVDAHAAIRVGRGLRALHTRCFGKLVCRAADPESNREVAVKRLDGLALMLQGWVCCLLDVHGLVQRSRAVLGCRDATGNFSCLLLGRLFISSIVSISIAISVAITVAIPVSISIIVALGNGLGESQTQNHNRKQHGQNRIPRFKHCRNTGEKN